MLVSHPYNAPAPNTNTAPSIISSLSLFPKSHILSIQLTNFLTFKTIVTVTALEFAPSRLTPVIHASWVMEFRNSMYTDLGIMERAVWMPEGMYGDSDVGRMNFGDSSRRAYCVRRVPWRGKNMGRERKWE